MAAGQRAGEVRELVRESRPNDFAALVDLRIVDEDVFDDAGGVIERGDRLEVRAIVGAEPAAHDIERVEGLGCAAHSSPITLTTTRLRRWPSNSA